MVKIAMCDDDLKSIKFVQKLLESELISLNINAEISIVTDDQKEIEKLIKNNQIDFLILDVEFNNSKTNGIEFAKKLRKYNKNFYLIFLSGHQRFLYPSLVTKIFDYIVKPANRDTIHELAVRIKEEIEHNDSLFISVNKWQTIKASEIIYMEKDVNKTVIITDCGNISCTKTLDKMQNSLPSNFVRCHRSFIINKDKILLLDKKAKEVHLENNIICPINSKFII